MLAAGRRTYGRGLARSTLSVSQCYRLAALGADGSSSSSSSAVSRAERVCPASTQAARQQHSGGSTPVEDRPTTAAAAAAAEENTPWLRYQRSMYMRAGLKGIGNRHPRQGQVGLVSPAAGTALDARHVAMTTPGKTSFNLRSAQGSDAVGAPGVNSGSSSSSSSSSSPEPAAATEAASTDALATTTSAREASGSAGRGSSTAAAEHDEGFPSAERRVSGAASSAAEEPSLFSLHASPASASPAIVGSPREIGSMDKDEDGSAVRAHGGDSHREAALKAELERKFGTEPNLEPRHEAVAASVQNQGDSVVDDPNPASAVGAAAAAAAAAAADGASLDDSSSTQRSERSESSPEPPGAGQKRRRARRRGHGKGHRKAEFDTDAEEAVGADCASESRQIDSASAAGDPEAFHSDVEGDLDAPAAEGRRGGSRSRRSGGNKVAAAVAGAEGGGGDLRVRGKKYSHYHYEKQASAWNNIHAKRNLARLLAGLRKDYGVKELLSAHNISENTLSKLLPMFEDVVMNDPNTAFDGVGCQKAQKAITNLCYHDSFSGDAVLMKRPLRAKSSKGRTFVFPSKSRSESKSGDTPVKMKIKRGRETDFVRRRNDLVERTFIPRLIKLAQENFADEIEITRRMDEIVDLRNPQHGFPLARLRKRRIIYHGGPTNSGKTYQAIERLKKAGANRQPGDGPAGLFCGPLRLLALEVYEQLNSQGVYCSLMTGQEKREVPFATHVSCTIEMASTTNEYEVAVVDEIQMLADEQRGPSWTAAVLGLNCPEIHVCGGMEGAVLVEAMAKEMGDDFELKEYQRKTELVCAEDSLGGSYKNVQPGDAVVAFSRKDIFNIKREIESKTDYKCCVIFGSLPQETRAHQARLFNMEDTGYDVLVASDAIGMGLNLNIRRVVFHAVAKRGSAGGRMAVKLAPTLLKQIGGRAGRHGKQWEFGEVTCLRTTDMAYMNQVMNTPLESIPKAAIFPSVQRMQEFSNCLDATEPEGQERRRLAQTYTAFAERAKVGDRYFLGTHDQYQALANALHPIENLTLKERYAISMAPVNGRNALLVRAIFLFASAHAAKLPVFINMQLPQKGVLPKSMSEFQTLCSKHNVLDLYRWMGVRFPSIECFAERSVAEMQRLELESIINEALKRRIAVTGPDSISAPEHDTFEKKVLRILNDPKGGATFSVKADGGEVADGEDELIEYML